MWVPARSLREHVSFIESLPAIEVREGAHSSRMVHSMTESTVVWCGQVSSMSEFTAVVASSCQVRSYIRPGIGVIDEFAIREDVESWLL